MASARSAAHARAPVSLDVRSAADPSAPTLGPGGPSLGALTDDALTSRLRVWQRRDGHRYSIDDVATAWEAAHARPDARRIADLGSGIGSVALMLAHALPGARLCAIEAQEISFALLARNVARNALEARIDLVHGDLRAPDLPARLGGEPFDLVTGTPPYFPAGTATLPPDPQKAHARHELRGGVEAYVAACARLLAADGVAVVCADARAEHRVRSAAEDAGLGLRSVRPLVPREGKPALFSLFTVVRGPTVPTERRPPLVLRDASGRRTADERALRGYFGLSAPEDEAPSPPLRPRSAR